MSVSKLVLSGLPSQSMRVRWENRQVADRSPEGYVLEDHDTSDVSPGAPASAFVQCFPLTNGHVNRNPRTYGEIGSNDPSDGAGERTVRAVGAWLDQLKWWQLGDTGVVNRKGGINIPQLAYGVHPRVFQDLSPISNTDVVLMCEVLPLARSFDGSRPSDKLLRFWAFLKKKDLMHTADAPSVSVLLAAKNAAIDTAGQRVAISKYGTSSATRATSPDLFVDDLQEGMVFSRNNSTTIQSWTENIPAVYNKGFLPGDMKSGNHPNVAFNPFSTNFQTPIVDDKHLNKHLSQGVQAWRVKQKHFYQDNSSYFCKNTETQEWEFNPLKPELFVEIDPNFITQNGVEALSALIAGVPTPPALREAQPRYAVETPVTYEMDKNALLDNIKNKVAKTYSMTQGEDGQDVPQTPMVTTTQKFVFWKGAVVNKDLFEERLGEGGVQEATVVDLLDGHPEDPDLRLYELDTFDDFLKDCAEWNGECTPDHPVPCFWSEWDGTLERFVKYERVSGNEDAVVEGLCVSMLVPNHTMWRNKEQLRKVLAAFGNSHFYSEAYHHRFCWKEQTDDGDDSTNATEHAIHYSRHIGCPDPNTRSAKKKAMKKRSASVLEFAQNADSGEEGKHRIVLFGASLRRHTDPPDMLDEEFYKIVPRFGSTPHFNKQLAAVVGESQRATKKRKQITKKKEKVEAAHRVQQRAFVEEALVVFREQDGAGDRRAEPQCTDRANREIMDMETRYPPGEGRFFRAAKIFQDQLTSRGVEFHAQNCIQSFMRVAMKRNPDDGVMRFKSDLLLPVLNVKTDPDDSVSDVKTRRWALWYTAQRHVLKHTSHCMLMYRAFTTALRKPLPHKMDGINPAVSLAYLGDGGIGKSFKAEATLAQFRSVHQTQSAQGSANAQNGDARDSSECLINYNDEAPSKKKLEENIQQWKRIIWQGENCYKRMEKREVGSGMSKFATRDCWTRANQSWMFMLNATFGGDKKGKDDQADLEALKTRFTFIYGEEKVEIIGGNQNRAAKLFGRFLSTVEDEENAKNTKSQDEREEELQDKKRFQNFTDRLAFFCYYISAMDVQVRLDTVHTVVSDVKTFLATKGVDIKNKTRKNANLNKLCWMSAVELAIVVVFDVLGRPCTPENYHHIHPVRNVDIMILFSFVAHLFSHPSLPFFASTCTSKTWKCVETFTIPAKKSSRFRTI